MKRTRKRPLKLAALQSCSVLLLLIYPVFGAEQKASREDGQFDIYVAGKKIGGEKFLIQNSTDSVSSSSTMNLRDPANSRQNIKMETELKMNGQLVPQAYLLRTEVNGQKGLLKGTFAAGQASFEYLAGGSPLKRGLLVGDRFVVLDTNVFYHFVFIARLFDFESKEKTQSMEVVIPQELDNGVLKVSEMGVETTSVHGKKRELHHLRADSGTVKIDLWIDDHRILYKIALPLKGIEVIRD
jgi:hypothetical protein